MLTSKQRAILRGKANTMDPVYIVGKGEIDETLIQGVKAGMFWSKNRIRVQDPAAFAPKLIRYMLEQQLLEDAGGLRYRLRK